MLGRTNFPPIGESALRDHTGALRLLLVPAAGARQVGAGDRPAPARNSRRWSSPTRPGCRWRARSACSSATCCRAFWPADAGSRNAAIIHDLSSGRRLAARCDSTRIWRLRSSKQRADTKHANYLLPLSIKWTRFDPMRPNSNALAAVRRGPQQGTLIDASADASFISSILENLRASRTIEGINGFSNSGRRAGFRRALKSPIQNVRAVDTEQSNTTALVDNQYVVKLFRRLQIRRQSRD